MAVIRDTGRYWGDDVRIINTRAITTKITPTENGRIYNIKAYFSYSSMPAGCDFYLKPVIWYSNRNVYKVGSVTHWAHTGGGGGGWKTMTFNTPVHINKDADYWIGIIGTRVTHGNNTTFYIEYDATNNQTVRMDNTNSYSSPNSLEGGEDITSNVSLYASYYPIPDANKWNSISFSVIDKINETELIDIDKLYQVD